MQRWRADESWFSGGKKSAVGVGVGVQEKVRNKFIYLLCRAVSV